MTTVLVTGASRGIGRAVAEALVRRGDHVVGVARDGTRLSELATVLGARFVPAPLDLEAEGCGEALRALVVEHAVSGLVHAAGQAKYGTVEQTTGLELRQHFELHVVVGFELARAIAARGGPAVLVFLSSTLVSHPAPSTLAYSVAKGALEGLVRSLAYELAPNVRVNAVALGVVDTDMVRAARPDGLNAEQRLAQLASRHALGGLVALESAVDTILHALDSKAMTGSVLTLDAGLSLNR